MVRRLFLYPVNLKAAGLRALVIGGGHVALRKVKKLIAEEADVTILAPEVVSDIEALSEAKKVHWEKHLFRGDDLSSYGLIVTACGVREVAEAVQQASKESHFLYNAADFPSLGNCSLPAAFNAGGIQITVSTNGCSPAMARYMKEWLSLKIPEGFGLWLDRVGKMRVEMKERISTSEAREAFWRAVFTEDIMHLVMQGKLDEAEECVRHAVGRFGAES